MVGEFSNLCRPQIFFLENYVDLKDSFKSPLVPIFYNALNCNTICKWGISVGLMKAEKF